MKRIVLTGGGTAGHVMPALALVPYLRADFGEIHYVGQAGGVEETLAKKAGLPFFGTQTIRFERQQWWKNGKIPFVLHKAVQEVYAYLVDIGASVVFSKGGYCALPAVLAAHKAGIPIVCHESDYSLGLANRVSLLYTKHLLTSFADTPKGRCMGNPIRDEITCGNALACPKFAAVRPVLLVMGGSLGAWALNRALVDAMPLLRDYNVINLYGRSPVDYRAPNYLGLPYADNIADYLALADVVLCRAGANTLFELAALAKPTVTVPLPKGNSRGDQVQNARYFAMHYGFVHLPQDRLSPDNILQAVQEATTQSISQRYQPQNAKIARYIASCCDKTHADD